MTLEEREKDNDQDNQKETKTDTPLIKPGYDYIWGSDQDDLVEGKEE